LIVRGELPLRSVALSKWKAVAGGLYINVTSFQSGAAQNPADLCDFIPHFFFDMLGSGARFTAT
jgi:hypothetical protein